jgi:hypothetical protein
MATTRKIARLWKKSGTLLRTRRYGDNRPSSAPTGRHLLGAVVASTAPFSF